MGRWIGRHRRACRLAVSLLILALLPTPWPKVECHNVRHHDGAGQVCEYHDHLLRWHPDAGEAADVAVLHWHWAWPDSDTADVGHDGDEPRLHAHLGPEALPVADPGPTILVAASARGFVPAAVVGSSIATLVAPPVHLDLIPARPDIPDPARRCGSLPPRGSITIRLHRWTC